MNKDQILLGHGDGGRLTRNLVEDIFAKAFANPALKPLADAALIRFGRAQLAFTTDSYVVKPIFFPGGDIGQLAVFGTCNDLAVMGSKPVYLSCGFILEEGLELDTLKKVVGSMKLSAQKAGVKLVTGDTKVVERGSGDKIFINTAGIGERLAWPSMGSRLKPGDEILLSGTVGDHGIAVLCARGELKFSLPVESDCGPVWPMVKALRRSGIKVKWMRDPTRGGVAGALNELANGRDFGIEVFEDKIPLTPAVDSACEVLGLDPLYLANEGKVICIVQKGQAEPARKILRKFNSGRSAEIFGRVIPDPKGKVIAKTGIGGARMLSMPAGAPLPRIC